MEKSTSNSGVTWVAALWYLMCNYVACHKDFGRHGNKTSILSLQNELIIDILSRVPAPSVLACKAVSSSWCRLINSPEFAERHLNTATPVILGHFSHRIKAKEVWFSINDFGLKPRLSKVKVNRLEIVRHFSKPRCYASCNGVLIFGDGLEQGSQCRYGICNPATREEIAFSLGKGETIYGLYFHGLEKEYKLLIYRWADNRGYYSIYGLSTKVRRTLDINKRYTLRCPGVAAFGALFWWSANKKHNTSNNTTSGITVDSYDLLMFNPDTEIFVKKPQPTDRYKREGRITIDLFEIEGKLWWCDVYAKSVQIWILEDIETWKWVQRYVVNLNGHINDDDRDQYDANSFFVLGIQNGNMLFRSYGGLLWCNLRSNKVTKINTSNVDLRKQSYSVYGTQYVGSLVSLANSNILPETPERF